MNFFARQAESRKLTRRLVVLFVLAVIAVVVAVDLVVFTILASTEYEGAWRLPDSQWLESHPGAVALTTLTVLGIIGLSSLYKSAALSSGGGAVARTLGGVRISQDTTDPLERRLLNVVEEMAIASGAPMPEVYLLEQEAGINAFAAGHQPSDAAIAVTRGALNVLSRAELQGVIAHEFSHILNGDMRMNVRLMGLLFGLLVIAIIARTVLRFAPRGRSGRRGGGVAIVFLAAAAILVIGYVGLFFGRLIQAAVSRSRESLADASAVQFTREPSGLRGALVKIAASSAGSRIADPEGEEVAHMLFAPGMRRLFATHPPLLERLKTIDPRFDAAEIDAMRARLSEAANPQAVAPDTARAPVQNLDDSPAPDLARAAGIVELIGNPATAHMQAARAIRSSLPERIVAAGSHVASARALVLALALEPDADMRAQQRGVIVRRFGEPVASAVGKLQDSVDALEPEQRLPAFLRTLPALRQMTRDERLQLLAGANALSQAAGRPSLPSYAFRKLLQTHLSDDAGLARRGVLHLNAVAADVQVLLSALAQHGHVDAASARRAYEMGAHHLYPRERPGYAPQANWTAALDAALSRLDRLAAPAKEQLVEALAKTVMHDRRLTIGEAELLRAVCGALRCPLPPLVSPASAAPTQALSARVQEQALSARVQDVGSRL